jgi:threonyl-tRNA synthetase
MQDHRKLGRELELFDTDPLIGAGLPYWLPAGAAIRYALEEYVRERERQAGFQHVYSPVVAKRELYEISGHWSHFRDGMFAPMPGEGVVLRPSLCPHHALIFRSKARSYRELPLRIAELGGMYRAELSGVLGGLSRVRSIQLNDGHIFCALDQVAGEVAAGLAMIGEAHQAMGLDGARYRLSLPGSSGNYAGSRPAWDQAAAILAGALRDAGIRYDAEEGEAAFYGPKIDVQVADSAEREISIATVQVDFYQPERFDLRYTGSDGSALRPVMVHRSVLGSLERIVAHLTERHGGAFPPWLAPVQLVALPITDDQFPPAEDFVCAAVRAGLRAELSGPEHGTLAGRIRANRLVPYQAVIGAREASAGEAALRLRDGRQLPPMPTAELIELAGRRSANRDLGLWPDSPAALPEDSASESAVD